MIGLTQLPLKDVDEKGEWKETTRECKIVFPGGATSVVPPGYRSNGASIPKWLQPVVGAPWKSDYAEAALHHDYFCDVSDTIDDYNLRVQGDATFWNILRMNAVPYWKSMLMYYAVRWNGIIHFFVTKRFLEW